VTTLRRLTRPLLGISVLVAVLLTVSPGAVANRLGNAEIGLALVGIAGLSATHLIAAATWRLLLAMLGGIRLPWHVATRLFYAAQAIGAITPANVGGDVHRAVALRSAGHEPRTSVAPLLIQRAASYVALALLAVVALVPIAGQAEAAAPFVLVGCAFAIGIVVALSIAIVPGRLDSVRARVFRNLGFGAAAASSLPVHVALRAGLVGVALGAAFHAAAIACTWLLIVAVDPSVPALPAIAAIAIARLSLAVPFTPSGVGVQEGALSLLFEQLGMSPGTALAGMLLARLSLLMTTAVGAFLLARPNPGTASPGRSSISTGAATSHRG
jgi:uncharacterized membrane protein YbhN (UPF0104 family)